MNLAPALDALYSDFNREDSVSDPVHRVRPFPDAADREIAGFCAAALAFGRVASVLNSIDTLFAIMGPRPAQFVRSFDPSAPPPELRRMVHRWTRGADLAALLWILRQMLEQSGSIEGFFLDGDDAAAADVSAGLDSFSRRALALDIRRAYGRVPKRPGVCYFFPRPSAGSACKRLNLFVRWMVRKDAVDLGVWTRVSPSRLIVPLDTHVIRLGRCLRLTRYTSPGWKMAADITASLRRLDPNDPVRFDFSICHVGMMNACGFGRKQGDAQCPLRGLCHPRDRRSPSSPRSSPVPRSARRA
ncbi:MAG TPA: TIGR02757 family protein [Vicinamibacterales bacterium]|nr:TIGR02757 family protein [Vicinamibacterales bacterium]